MQYVLLIAAEPDIHAQCVAREVLQLPGYEAIIFDSARFPGDCSLSLTPTGGRLKFHLALDGEHLDNHDIAGVWWRRPETHAIDAKIDAEETKRFCVSESRSAFMSWLHSLGQRVINPPHAEARANLKPYQLMVATEVGLLVPPTLVSNQPDDVREFRSTANGETVFKVLTTTRQQMAETRELTDENEKQLDLLTLAPAIFQHYVPGVDIRATIVDDNVFAVEVRPIQDGVKFDWRVDQLAEYSEHNLPGSVSAKLVELNKRLGLRYGAIDLKLTPDGDYVFLEVNPSGQFLFKEIYVGHPISAAIGKALCTDES